MSIYHQVLLPSGNTRSYHRAVKAEADFETESLSVIIQSWDTRESFLAGHSFDMSSFGMPFSAFPHVEQALTEVVAGLFFGGLVEVEGDTELESARARRHTDVKRWRSEVIYTNLSTPYGVFQCNPDFRQDLTNSILLAKELIILDQPVAFAWTLLDNSVVTLGMQDLVTIGLILGQRVQTAHARARELRTLIDSYTTVEQVNALTWETT